MNRTLRHGLILFTAGIGASLGHIATATAADPQVFPAVLKLSAGVGGELEKNGGPGNEQAFAAVMTDKGAQYVVVIDMNSNVEQQDNAKYWQCKCTSVLMDPILGPRVMVSEKQITDNGGERSCNHPRIASDGLSNYGVWVYGSNDNNTNHTRTYAQGIDNMCNVMGDRLRISEDDNQNEGAPDIQPNGAGYYTAAYLSTANTDQDHVQAIGLKADMATGVAKMWSTNVINPSNIGRPAMVPVGTDKTFLCASQGNYRPEEQGSTCALLNAMTGDILHKELLFPSDPDNHVYMQSPTVAKISDSMMAINVIESNGNGRKSNIKGANKTHLYAYSISGDTFTKQAYANGVGLAPTHSSICGGTYGDKGETRVAVYGMSPTGTGQPSMQFTSLSGSSFKADVAADNWVVGYYGDSGRLSNLYGPNPNDQGREFPMCIGNVKNPGFGVKSGYMNTVETFFLAPHTGNNGTKEELKNGLYLTFVPGRVSVAVAPQQPNDPNKAISVPSGVGDPTANDAPVTDPGADPSDPNVNVGGGRAAGCSVPASGGSAPANLAFLALGVAGLLAARRRR